MLSITEGNVFIMKSGTDNWVEAPVGTSLEPGDTIKADGNSHAVITFFEGSTIELQAGTQIEVATLDFVTDTGSTYEVETLAGVAAVRGSTMLVNVIKGGRTTVINEEGTIWAIAQGVEIQVPEGRKCIIVPGQPPLR